MGGMQDRRQKDAEAIASRKRSSWQASDGNSFLAVDSKIAEKK
jgi:hypothetical protein